MTINSQGHMSGDRMSGLGLGVYLPCTDCILLPNAPFPTTPPTRRQNSMEKGPVEMQNQVVRAEGADGVTEESVSR